MRRGFGRDSGATEVLLDPSHGMLKNSVKYGSERSLNENSFSELVFETVGKQSKKKNREHRLTLPGIHITPVANPPPVQTPKSGDSGEKKKIPTMTLDDGVNKVTLSPSDCGGNNNSSKIVRSPSFRRKKAQTEQPPPECNIVLLGAFGVGKTALAVRFVTKRYLHEYDPRLERSYERLIEFDGENILIRLWDTVNKEWDYFADTADAFAVVYSITSMESYKNATKVVKSIRKTIQYSTKNFPVILLGNKMEMEQGRTVKKDTAECFASQNGCSFSELSVATNNADSIFNGLIKQVKADRTVPPENRKQGTTKYSFKSFLSKNMSKIK